MKANEPAFPSTNPRDIGGLTKREYFAAKFMAAIISKTLIIRGQDKLQHAAEEYAMGAVIYADALIEEINLTRRNENETR